MIFDLTSINFSSSDRKKGLALPRKMSIDLAEEIGIHIGDGSMNIYSKKGFYQLRGHIHDDKPHYLRRISELYKKLYNIDVNIRNMPSTGVIGFQVWSDALVEFKSSILKLPLGKKTDIRIPKVIDSKKLFFAFMRGLFDTDGCLYLEKRNYVYYPRVEIRMASESLRNHIITLSQKYGLPIKHFRFKRKEKNWEDICTLRLNGLPSLKIWNNLIGTNNPKHQRKMRLLSKKGGPGEI
ncbi:hypothetical protein GOV09_03245 [Candidatus Woesearchaeota archaeon]|nr:hypothetical protein [Candidatus Woesearchaeota archaeon]